MAGDTLRGIGKKELAEALESSPEATPERTTEPDGAGAGAAQASDTTTDIDIEEGRPVRSLDELPSDRTAAQAAQPLAARPVADNPAQTLLGMMAPVPIAPDIAADIAPETAPEAPRVDDAVPLGTTPATPRSGPNRVSFGTMIGHEMHAVQARVAAAIAEAEAGVRGTAHGRDVHLPASPGMSASPEPVALSAPVPPVETSAISSTNASSPALGTTAAAAAAPKHEPAAISGTRDSLNEFSGGDHSFFDTAPVNDEYEPENPRGRLYTRLAVAGAVVAVVSVVVVAWVNSHGSSEEPPPVEIRTAAKPAAPPARPALAPAPRPATPPPAATPVAAAPAPSKEPPPTSTIPSSMPEPIPAPAPSVAAAPVRVAKAAPATAASEPRAPSIAPPPAVRDERKPASAATASPAARSDQKPITAAASPVKAAAEPAAPARDKKPAAVAARPAEAPHAAAPPKPREVARPASPPPAPKVATPSPAARATHPEASTRPAAKPAAPPSPARAQKGTPARGKGKYDPDGTLPLSFD